MIWRIRISPAARDSIAALPENRQREVMAEILSIPETLSGSERLRGSRTVHRLKFMASGNWNYRVLFSVKRGKSGGTIRVFQAGIRDAGTYKRFNPKLRSPHIKN